MLGVCSSSARQQQQCTTAATAHSAETTSVAGWGLKPSAAPATAARARALLQAASCCRQSKAPACRMPCIMMVLHGAVPACVRMPHTCVSVCVRACAAAAAPHLIPCLFLHRLPVMCMRQSVVRWLRSTAPWWMSQQRWVSEVWAARRGLGSRLRLGVRGTKTPVAVGDSGACRLLFGVRGT